MKSIHEYLNDQRMIKTMGDIYTHKLINLEAQPAGGHLWTFRKDARAPEASAFVGLIGGSSLVASEGYVLAQLYGIGPKIFQPTPLQFQMMEHMTVNVPCSDYEQPFHTMIFEIPEGSQYQADYIDATYNKPMAHKPIFLIMHYAKHVKTIFPMLMFDSGDSIKMIIRLDLTEEIEDAINFTFKLALEPSKIKAGEIASSESENKIQEAIVRAAINYCFLIDEAGTLCKGPHNPSYYNRLQKHAKGKHPAQAKESLHLHPVIYTVNQNIELFKVSKDSLINDPNFTGRIQSPHWRRGHYRQQPHGPNNSLRKRIRVPHVFVNMHKFNGEMINTKATYHEK